MFAIYDAHNGQTFYGPLEQLHKVQQLDPAERSKLSLKQHAEQQKQEEMAAHHDQRDGGRLHHGVDAYRQMLQVEEHQPIIHAYQLMSSPVITLGGNESIQQAYQLFLHHDIHVAPVMEEEKIIGIQTEKALLHCLIYDEGKNIQYLRGKRVHDTLIRRVLTADPVTDVRRIAQVMLDYHLHGLPIVDKKGKLVGIVTRSDLLKGVAGHPPLTLWS